MNTKSFKIVRGAVDSQTLELVKQAMLMMKTNQYAMNGVPLENRSAFSDGRPVTHDCWGIYGSTVTEALMLTVQPIVEAEFNVKLHPTYSFCRIYWTGSDMVKHVDRPACEYSVSLCISTDPTPWPIWFEGEEVILEPGDLVAYKGIEVEHWRTTYTGKEQYQVFLHYVAQNGPHANQKLDSRPLLGLVPPKR